LTSLYRVSTETFTSNWRGWIRSSEGFSVRLMGRTGIRYTDELRDQHISAEPMNSSTELVVYTTSIPDRPERTRAEVVSRLRRAFDYDGWTIVEEDS
jgi:hypothetical protein